METSNVERLARLEGAAEVVEPVKVRSTEYLKKRQVALDALYERLGEDEEAVVTTDTGETSIKMQKRNDGGYSLDIWRDKGGARERRLTVKNTRSSHYWDSEAWERYIQPELDLLGEKKEPQERF